MRPSPFHCLRAGRIHVFAFLWALLAVVSGHQARADGASGDELKLAIVLSRHGVRAPLLSNEDMAALASQPWPKWEVGPSIQTPHGNLLLAYLGDYYRTRFVGAGILSGDPVKDGPLVFVRADNDQRTIETGRILGKALVRSGEPDVHSLPEGTIDPLFRAARVPVGHPDQALAISAVVGRLGGDPRNLERAYAPQFDEIKGILYGPGGPPADSPFNAPSTVVPGHGDLVEVDGPLRAAERCADSFLLEYTDGKPAAEVGWGKVDAKVMTDLLTLHELFFDLVCRTPYVARVEGSNLASHIVDTLEQGALGQPVPGALGPAGERVVVIVGHDSNIANIGGLFGLEWMVPGTQLNPMLPGGAPWWSSCGGAGARPDSFYVRISYVTQTLEQMRDATPLSADNPPALAPIFIPGCSGQGPGFDAPLASFVRQARKVIDPSFIAPEP